jgi:hypothetical protein
LLPLGRCCGAFFSKNSKAYFCLGKGFRRDILDVPEWGGKVIIRELSAGEILEIARIQMQGDSAQGVLAAMLIGGWIDADGNNLFTWDDEEALAALPAGIVTRIANAVSELSGESGALVNGKKSDPVADAKNA